MKFKIQVIDNEEVLNEITLSINSGITLNIGNKKVEIDIKEII